MIKEYIKKIGTGPHGARDLTRTEACDAARILLSGRATPAQVGALLLGLRLKGETAEETGGFLDALREALPPLSVPPVDLDIGDPYDGKKRTLSLVVPAAIAASELGVKIALHGLSGVPVKQGPGVLEVWRSLGRPLASFSELSPSISSEKVVCLSQDSFLPGLARLLPIRQELGLRTLWNTVEKAVNPFSGRAQAIGIFHEPVIDKLRHALNNGRTLSAERILFVLGSEGGVDLYLHRATQCYLLDPALGPELKSVIVPPPPEHAGTLPPPEDPASIGHFLRDILDDPNHPKAIHLKRQTALFLFAAGKYNAFNEAENALSAFYSEKNSNTIPSLWSRP